MQHVVFALLRSTHLPVITVALKVRKLCGMHSTAYLQRNRS